MSWKDEIPSSLKLYSDQCETNARPFIFWKLDADIWVTNSEFDFWISCPPPTSCFLNLPLSQFYEISQKRRKWKWNELLHTCIIWCPWWLPDSCWWVEKAVPVSVKCSSCYIAITMRTKLSPLLLHLLLRRWLHDDHLSCAIVWPCIPHL